MMMQMLTLMMMMMTMMMVWMLMLMMMMLMVMMLLMMMVMMMVMMMLSHGALVPEPHVGGLTITLQRCLIAATLSLALKPRAFSKQGDSHGSDGYDDVDVLQSPW